VFSRDFRLHLYVDFSPSLTQAHPDSRTLETALSSPSLKLLPSQAYCHSIHHDSVKKDIILLKMRRSLRTRQHNKRLDDYDESQFDSEEQSASIEETSRDQDRVSTKMNPRQQQAPVPLPSNVENNDPNILPLAVSNTNHRVQAESVAPSPQGGCTWIEELDDGDEDEEEEELNNDNISTNANQRIQIRQSESDSSDFEDSNPPVDARPQQAPRRSARGRIVKKRALTDIYDSDGEGEGVEDVPNISSLEVVAAPPRRRRRTSSSEEEYRPPRWQAGQAIQRRAPPQRWPQRAATAGVAANDIDESKWPYKHIGAYDEICKHCGAPRWKDESTRGKICCCNGDAVTSLKGIFNQRLPVAMESLYFDSNPQARQFRKNIRHYNTVLSMASSGINLQHPTGGVSMLAIKGGIYHKMGPLEPAAGTLPSFAQIYILDDDAQLAARMALNNNGHMHAGVLGALQRALIGSNSYVQQFRQVSDDMRSGQVGRAELIINANSNRGATRVYAAPTASEIAAFLPGVETEGQQRQIRIRYRASGDSGDFVFISDLNPAFDPLHFVLFHPRGEPGWSPEMKLSGTSRKNKGLSPSMFASYFMHLRYRSPEQFRNYAIFVLGGRLFQEWLVTMYCKIEGCRLQYLRHNQTQLRAELYNKVSDAVAGGETNGERVGVRVVLPSSFVGGPRYMMQNYQDAMALVRKYGRPDYFVTMTCNPKWDEVTNALEPGQQPNERPDILNRVFRIKLNSLLQDLKQSLLGKPRAMIFVIEFQKRGLAHAHILVIVDTADKPRCSEDVDMVISAEIPDPVVNPRLHKAVVDFMLHGPCGHDNPTCPCMKDGACSKQFPKAFQENTELPNDGYPIYRRGNNGRTYQKSPGGFVYDNRHVVPYCPALLLKYQCHINVEMCNTISAVKYLFKYVYKGHDRAEADVVVAPEGEAAQEDATDEIKQYLDGRYVSASEAHWRISSFEMHGQTPAVTRLQVHLPGQQLVHFNPAADLMDALVDDSTTILMDYFKFVAAEWARYKETCVEGAEPPPLPVSLTTTYVDFPGIATYTKGKGWSLRKNTTTAVGRLYHVSPGEGERWYLRLLLHHVTGATSFDDVKNRAMGNRAQHSQHSHTTFKDACQCLGLLDDDSEFDRCLSHASECAFPAQLRAMFSTILLFNEVIDPLALLDAHMASMAEDYLFTARQLNPDRELDQDIRDRVLREIACHLQEGSRDLRDFGLPQPADQLPAAVVADELSRYDEAIQREYVEQWKPLLNSDQSAAYEGIMGSADYYVAHYNNNNNSHQQSSSPPPNVFFVDGIGGSGKTALYNVLLSTVRGRGRVAMAVASSGIAALLLEGGRTAHSRFKIPVQGLHKDSVCFISVQSSQADLIRATDIIVWDEACMMHKHAFMAVDRSLRDIMATVDPRLRSVPFGGKVVVLGGDFRQILPVVQRGKRSDIVAASLNRAPTIWSNVKQYRLHINMRVQRLLAADRPDAAAQALEQQEYADFLKRVGDGTEPGRADDGKIEIPSVCCCQGETLLDLIEEVYGDLDGMSPDQRAERITKCAILAPLNSCVDALNDMITEQYKLPDEQGNPATERIFYSADSARDCQPNLYPTEFLNKLEFSGVPPHVLRLRLGSPIILLRNMASGLANGTRMLVKSMSTTVIEALVTTGPKKGQTVFIPRLLITPSDVAKYPFTLCRRQFPIRPAYAMTINKSQGQTLESAGVYLPKPVFTHGQLYTALSRTGAPKGMAVLAERDENGKMYTANVVYKEVLL
jgi:hypothetical protein